jgi:hypothetical protein
MTIVRIGLGESKDYGEGWNAIFGRGKAKAAKPKASAKKKGKAAKKKK